MFNFRKITLFHIFLIVVLLPTIALPFNKKLSESDLESLNKGEVLIKSIDKYKNVSIEGQNLGIAKIRQEIEDLNPNYLAEIIQVRPYKGNENLIQDMRAVLEDIPNR